MTQIFDISDKNLGSCQFRGSNFRHSGLKRCPPFREFATVWVSRQFDRQIPQEPPISALLPSTYPGFSRFGQNLNEKTPKSDKTSLFSKNRDQILASLGFIEKSAFRAAGNRFPDGFRPFSGTVLSRWFLRKQLPGQPPGSLRNAFRSAQKRVSERISAKKVPKSGQIFDVFSL